MSTEEVFEAIDKEIKEALESNYKVLPQLECSNELYYLVRGKIDALQGVGSFVEKLRNAQKVRTQNELRRKNTSI